MQDYKIHSKIFYDFGSFKRKNAVQLIKLITSSSPYKISKYSTNSTRFKTYDESNLNKIANIVTDYPSYFSGMLFLTDNKKNILFMLEHDATKLFKLSIFIDDQKYSIEGLGSFFKKLTKIDEAIFGFIDSKDSYIKKHLLITKGEDGNTTEQYIGQDFSNGIPGLYPLTYLNESLGFSLQIENKQLNKLNIEKDDGFYLTIDDENSYYESIETLGKDFFFDIKETNVKKTYPFPLNDRIEYLSNIYRLILPQYTLTKLDSKFRSKPESSSIDSNLSDINFEDMDKSEIIISNIFSQNLSNNEYLYFLKIIGEKLGDYWASKFNIEFDKRIGIKLVLNDDMEYIINPFHVIILVYEDLLKISDFEESIIDLFDL
jgi:hypothetical protein